MVKPLRDPHQEQEEDHTHQCDRHISLQDISELLYREKYHCSRAHYMRHFLDKADKIHAESKFRQPGGQQYIRWHAVQVRTQYDCQHIQHGDDNASDPGMTLYSIPQQRKYSIEQ